jgi:abnormal spindle-like microcephaly-associated protein
MRRFAESTPCPAPHPSFSSNPYDEHGRWPLHAPSYDDTTANIEYTTEIQPILRHAKPRRPLRALRKPVSNPSLNIFEDVAQEEEEEQQQQQQTAVVQRKSGASVAKKGAILAHKPQKRVALAPAIQAPHPPSSHRRRVSQLLSERQGSDVNATVQLQEDVLERRELKKQGQKDPRRRTIYVPSDDTTMMTIHPGQSRNQARNPREKSPDMGFDLVTLSDVEPQSILKKEKKTARKSLAAPPKRVPLQQSQKPHQPLSFSEDVLGTGGGKENVPPGAVEIQFNLSKDDSKKPAVKANRVHFNTSKPTEPAAQPGTKRADTQKRLRSQISYDGSPAKSIKAKVESVASASHRPTVKSVVRSSIRSQMSQKARAPLLSSSPFHTDKSPPNALRRQKVERAPTKITMLHVVGKPPQPREKFPVLSEDLARPELYEDHWLTYQEVAITQLLNSIFDSAGTDYNTEQSPEELRGKMLALYLEPEIPLLHKRLQASLLYGALSIPKDLIAQTLRLKDDVGMRKKFLNLWVKSYNLTSLRAALEAVIGRQITVPSRLSTGSTSSDDGTRQFRSERRAIEAFLDAFLIRNEDAGRVKSGNGSIASIARGDRSDDFGSQGWSWRRTALRSLMLAHLLDRAKSADILPGCLFQPSSPHKTSTDILHALAGLLLPSHGDITRPLGHLNYKVEHVQYPLEEYHYHIENIAIDLRDGIILTRLVELMLYPPSTLVAQHDETVTITMPTGELLASTVDLEQKGIWVLSQHLKLPSIGRAQKLYNVQVALAALTGVRGIPIQAVGGITSEDIVNGHREKTLSLLWSLVGKCGLGTLVDWPQIVKETNRFRDTWYNNRDNYDERDLDSDEDEATSELDGLEYHKRRLLSWSRSIARLHGLRVSNLTTSFSDPRVLEAIVDTYLPSSLSSASASPQLSLAAKLKATGCSTSFIALFAQQNSSNRTIPSRDFTLLTLSFLASRLLPLSITHRAAAVIQRAYRLRLERKVVHKRVVLMRLAAECAVVAKKRQELVATTMVFQRRWRAIQDTRKTMLEHDIEAFQALARGWAIRRWARRVTGGRIGGKEKVRRMRGGW